MLSPGLWSESLSIMGQATFVLVKIFARFVLPPQATEDAEKVSEDAGEDNDRAQGI